MTVFTSRAVAVLLTVCSTCAGAGPALRAYSTEGERPSVSVRSGSSPPPSAPSVSKTCVACHGPDGVSPNDLWPNLAGQKAAYLIKQLKDFRGEKRTDPLMSGVAKMLNDREIEELASYYSRQRAPP